MVSRVARGRSPEPDSSERRGFSFIEVIIAMVILTVGVLGLAGTTGYIVRQVTLADVMTKRAAALQSVLDRIQAAGFDSAGTGSDSVGIFAVRWNAVLNGPQVKDVTVITIGPGLETASGATYTVLGPSVADTFKFKVIRP